MYVEFYKLLAALRMRESGKKKRNDSKKKKKKGRKALEVGMNATEQDGDAIKTKAASRLHAWVILSLALFLILSPNRSVPGPRWYWAFQFLKEKKQNNLNLGTTHTHTHTPIHAFETCASET